MAQFLVCTVPALLWTPDSRHLAWMIAAVACGLAISSCSGTLWVERHSVPEACLSYPWVDLVLSRRLAAVWLSSLLHCPCGAQYTRQLELFLMIAKGADVLAFHLGIVGL